MDTLFIDASGGVSGDMLLAACLDLGVPVNIINNNLEKLGLSGAYYIDVKEDYSFKLRGTKVYVNDRKTNHIAISELILLS